jgi:hypothetical protein
MRLLGLSEKELFLPTNMQPQRQLDNCLYYNVVGALRCKYHTAKVRETNTPRRVHVTSHVSSAEPVSHKCMREVSEGRFIKQRRMNEQVHMRG